MKMEVKVTMTTTVREETDTEEAMDTEATQVPEDHHQTYISLT